MTSTASESRATSDRRIPITAAFIPLVLLAFSDEFLDAIIDAFELRAKRPLSMPIERLVVPLDLAILMVILILKRRIRKRLRAPGRRNILLLWWWLGAEITIGLDWLATTKSLSRLLWFDLLTSTLYVVALTMLVTATIDARPSLLVRPRLRRAFPEEWVRVRAAIPLLVGTMGAYFAAVWWKFWLLPFNGGVNKEFFAQVSQVIALLIVALGIEVGFFRQAMRDATQRAMAIMSVSILCLGEAMALSALTSEDRLYDWHVYLAFIVTVEACLIALATLIWVLIVRPRPNPDPEPAGRLEHTNLHASHRAQPGGKQEPASRQKDAVVAAGIVVAIAVLAAIGSIRRSTRSARPPGH